MTAGGPRAGREPARGGLRAARRRRPVALRLLLVLALALGVAGQVTAPLAGAGLPTVAAEDLDTARAEAQQLRADLERLRGRLEMAYERRAEAQAVLDRAAGREAAAAQRVDAVARALDDRQAALDSAVRALYMSGGATAVYASLLDATSMADLALRSSAALAVLQGRVSGVAAAESALAKARQQQEARTRLTSDRVQAAGQARAAEAEARALQATLTARLQAADALVTRLLAEEEARAEAERQAAAAAALAAAGQVPWGSTITPPADEVVAVDRAIMTAAAQPVNPWAVAALTDARRWVGTPYAAGGGGPAGPSAGWCSSGAPDDGRDDTGACVAQQTIGFDCSSLVQRVFAAAGLALPRTSRQQWWAGRHIPLAQLAPGDLLFWAYDTDDATSIHHVALYLGDGLMLHAPHTGDRVRVAAVYTDGLIGAVRPGG